MHALWQPIHQTTQPSDIDKKQHIPIQLPTPTFLDIWGIFFLIDEGMWGKIPLS